MSVVFNVQAQRELLDAYSSTHDLIDGALPQLRAFAEEANAMINSSRSLGGVAGLEDAAFGLASDRADLSERTTFLQVADARTAFLLGTTPERLINPNLANRAMATGWNYDEALARQRLESALGQPRPHTSQQRALVSKLTRELAALDQPFTIGMSNGDLDSDLATPRISEPVRLSGSSPVERGRQLLLRALEDTTDPDRILRDEFAAYVHDNGALTIVLPGVIDLSNPRLGNDPETNSLRDLDQQAVRSAYNTNLENNGYASRIVEWAELMTETGVITPGASTAIVGHSFGAETAFDLATDERFNGELVNVTHIFAAGYDTETYLDDVPPHTRTMSARNIYDAVSFAELTMRQGPREPAARVSVELIEEVINFDRSVVQALVRATSSHDDEQDDEYAESSVNTRRETKDDPPVFLPEAEIGGDRFQHVPPNALDISFEGDFDLSSFGHHPDTYASFLENVEAPDVLDFFVELDAQGFTDNAVAVSVDISEPNS